MDRQSWKLELHPFCFQMRGQKVSVRDIESLLVGKAIGYIDRT